MPRPLFTANRQSANTLIWRRFDLFRRWRLLAWLIAAPIGYGYTATLLALYAKNLGGGTAWLAWYPLIYAVTLALVCHRSLIRLLWNPPILVCDENGLTAFNEYGRWLGQWQWAQIAELRATREPGDYYTLEVIMHGDTPPRPQPGETAPAHDLARYGESYIPAPDNPPAAEAPRERLLLPELGPELPQALDEIRHHRTRATLDTPRAETRAWYKHPRSIQRDNWRLFGWLAAALVGAPLLAALFLRGGISTLPAALYGLGCAILLLRPGWQALRRLIADPARPVARIDGEGIRINDGATRLHLPWRDLRRIENDDGVLVLTDYRDRHYRTLRAAGNDDRSLDAIITASRAMRDGEPLPDDTPLPPPRRRPLAWLLLANSLLLPASLTLLYLSHAPRETGLTLLALLAIVALAWWARQSHWQTQATYREPLPATPPAPRPDLPVRQWYRHPRAIARANWLAWWLLLPASLLAMRASDALPANIRLPLAILSALLALGAARLLWHTFAHADRPVARSDRDGLHLALTNPRQRDFHRILLYGTLGGSKLNFTIPWAELDDIDTAWRQNHKALTLSDPNGDQRAIRCHAVGGETIARGIARVVHAYKTHLDALADPIDYSDPEYLHFMERTLRGELPDDLDPDSELAQELRQILQATQPPPEIAEHILADIARRRAARSAKSIPPTHSQPPRIRPRAWWLLAANLAVAIALPALKALDSGIPAFWPFAVLTVLNLAAWRGDYRQQAVMQEERRPAPAATRPRHSVRNWYKPAHLTARANGRACARLFLLAMLGVPLANALAKHHTFFSLCLAIPAVLIARALWSELRYTFSQSDQPVARIDADGLHLAVRGNRLHAGAPNLHIPWDDLAAINAVPYDAPPWWFTTHEHLAIQTSSGDDYRIRTALLDDFASVQDIAHSASSNRTSSENRPRVAPPPPALPTAFARGLMVANLASVALWLIANLLLQHHLITLPYTEPPLPYDSYPLLNLLRILPFGAYPLTNAACWITFATVNIVARLLPAEWHTRPIMPAPEATATAMPVIHRNISCL
ncbi:hypothetical protein [Cardiobacterium hominis]|uniref:hypothetical protein n=1 Tax=Cardiobacterium hominis TaxID=2718 RepID=UPI0028EA7E5E|nr:hypothetical protein [Cardiobacterium hominis]